MLEPYGTENPAPVFMLRDAVITEILPLSCDKHIRITLAKDGNSVNGFCFGVSPQSFGFCCGDRIDIVFNLDVNVYRGIESPQVTIRDVKLSEKELKRINKEKNLFDKYENGRSLTEDEAAQLIPDMDDFTTVFRYLRRLKQEIKLVEASRRIANGMDGDFGICKLKVCLDVFDEMGLIKLEKIKNMEYNFEIVPTDEKVNLNKSKLLTKLRSISG